MARKDDAIDIACRLWAEQRRELVGLSEPKLAVEFIGAVRCSIAEKRDLHAGAKSSGRVVQHYPEVYRRDALEVNRAYKQLPPALKEIMDVHYVARAPIKLKVHRLGISWSQYWDRVRRAKSFVAGWLEMCKQKNDDESLTSDVRKMTIPPSVGV